MFAAAQHIPRRPHGFTLIEVLVALMIVSVALAAVVVQGSRQAQNATRLHDRTLAQWVAQNKIAEQQLSPLFPSPGTQHGSAKMGSREWQWRMRITATEDKDVHRLDVEVRRQANDPRPLAALVAYLGHPQ
ncbi:MAG: type II secretion system minor pseudopilin GspI [Gammaproteobacteria bacterium]|nr:type II secretion system minor pseudopilin GspI [Gammaproteobacteria bacterium]